MGTLLSGFYAVYQIGIRLVENERQEARRAAYYQRYSGQRAAPQQTQRERQLQVRFCKASCRFGERLYYVFLSAC